MLRNSQPLISIITVVLNGEHVIEQTILSVIAQKNGAIEYIVIDGGSKDGTVNIIKKYQQHITYWISEPDRGLYDAMNKGIKAAHGQCIGLLNAGDCYQPGTFQIVQRHMQEIKSRHYVIAGSIDLVDESGVSLTTLHVKDRALLKRFLFMPLNHPSMFVSSGIYDDFGLYNAERKIAADYEFVLALADHGVDFVILPVVLTYMRIGGLSGNPKMLITKLREAYDIRRNYKGVIFCILALLRDSISVLLSSLRNYMGWLNIHKV